MNELIPLEVFRANDTVKYGSSATSASVNHAPLVIKEELNSLYNYTRMKFSEEPLEWDATQTYQIGDYVEWQGSIYEANAVNGNQEPPNVAWTLFDTSTLDLELKYVQIHTDKYINLVTRNGYKMMRADTNATSAIMTPKNGLVPWDDGVSSDLGTSALKFNDIYGVNGRFNNVYTGTITATSGTFSSIDATTVTADTFDGVSTTALYADIAEKYTTDAEYAPGTVLGFGGTEELTLFKNGMRVAGVVSTQPGYMLNSGIEGTYIALKGRVPCFVNGNVLKGQYIIADEMGATAVNDYTFDESKRLLGIAISDSKDGIVEIKV